MIGVAITTYNRRAALARVLEAAVRTTSETTPIVVAWDGPADDDLCWWETHKLAYRWIDTVHGPRTGVAANRNRAVRALMEHGAELEWVVFLEDDVLPLKVGWDRVLVEAALGSEQAMMSRVPTYGDWPQRIEQGKRKIQRVEVSVLAERTIDVVWNVWATATGQAIRRDAFERVGLYDEGFGLYGHEHTEWQMRLHAAGMVDKAGHPHVAAEQMAPYLVDLDVPPSYQDEFGPEFEQMISDNGRRLGELARNHRRRYG